MVLWGLDRDRSWGIIGDVLSTRREQSRSPRSDPGRRRRDRSFGAGLSFCGPSPGDQDHADRERLRLATASNIPSCYRTRRWPTSPRESRRCCLRARGAQWARQAGANHQLVSNPPAAQAPGTMGDQRRSAAPSAPRNTPTSPNHGRCGRKGSTASSASALPRSVPIVEIVGCSSPEVTSTPRPSGRGGGRHR